MNGENNRQKHKTYGLISVSRINGDERNMFGSPIPCANPIKLEIFDAYAMRDLNAEQFYPCGKKIEVRLTPAQWAELLSSMNVGGGTPCTVHYERDNGGYHGECPYNPEFDRFSEEFDSEVQSAFQEVKDVIEETASLLEKGKANKTELQKLQVKLVQLERVLTDRIPFVQDSFNEYVNKAVTAGKQEIEAYLTSRIQMLGLEQAVKPQEVLPDMKGE